MVCVLVVVWVVVIVEVAAAAAAVKGAAVEWELCGGGEGPDNVGVGRAVMTLWNLSAKGNC